MFGILTTILLVFICITLYIVYLTTTKPNNFPPGPLCVPFIGSFFRMIPLHTKLLELSKVYGEIFSIKICRRNMVCLVGFGIIKEVLNDRAKEFSGRLHNPSTKILRGEEVEGIALADYGPKWASHRKLFLTTARDKKKMTASVIEEGNSLVRELYIVCDRNEPFDPADVIQYAILNVLAAFTFGDRYTYGDEKLKELLRINTAFFKEINALRRPEVVILNQIPYLYRYWLPACARRLTTSVGKILDFAQSEIDRHKESLDENHPRDFIDFYLLEMQKPNNEWFTEKQKVHKEIDDVIGVSRELQYEDRSSMPYCSATLLEIQRKASIAVVGVPHTATVDTTIRGYNIPKGTPILPSLYAMHHDPKQWKNPFHFDPENFLDPDGSVGTREAFMPFGVGLRVCAGINMAKQELFMFFVKIFQNFQVTPPPGVIKLSEEILFSAELIPVPYQIQIKRRN